MKNDPSRSQKKKGAKAIKLILSWFISLILLVVLGTAILYLLKPDQMINALNSLLFRHSESTIRCEETNFLTPGVGNAAYSDEESLDPNLADMVSLASKQNVTNEEVGEKSTALDEYVSELADEAMDTVFEAEYVYITDDQGQVLMAKNEHDTLYPASTTKLLTALVTMDHVEDLDAEITVGELSGCYESGSVLLWLENGDRLTVRDLLHAMLMVSYNDAATALAVEIGGSLEDFADMMNEKAAELGCVDSHFVTPHGLFDESHYTSAYDMNLILQAAMNNEEIAEVLNEDSYSFVLHGQSGNDYTIDLSASNYFLTGVYHVPGYRYSGGKTGYIYVARSCLCSAFTHLENGQEHMVYSVVMKALDASYMTSMALDYVSDPYAVVELAKVEPAMKEWILENERDHEMWSEETESSEDTEDYEE